MGTESPNKVAAETPDLNAERLAELRRLFPEAFTEGKLDVEKLRAALGEGVESRAERYSFTWAGKRDAIRLLQMPSRATLVPCREESVAFDTTNHVFIEGDNLEVLKLLYKSYAGRVKMIYIDPPYNTGNDFVYRDHYADPLDAYLRLTGQKDENGNHTSSKTETNGRYHSAWLSMMFPRLFVARQLLAEDGILFVSIDDIEQPRLRMLLDEVFGEEQFIAAFIWKSRHNVDSRDKTGVSSDHEYVVCYGQRVQGKEKDLGKYTNPDNDPRGPWMSDNMLGLATKDKRPNLHYDLINPETNINYGCPEKGWRFDKRTMARKIEEKRIIWPASPDGRPRHKKFLNELESRFTGFSSLLDVPTTSAGTQALRAIFGTEVFEFPKPVELVKALVKQGNGEDAIYLDFFAGVCPLAQAILEQNRNDGVSRRFIVVQLPEPTPKDSVARNMGFQTVADIGKERIRRVIAKVQQERDESLPLNGNAEDLGFRVFKLAESNFRQWKAVEEHDFETWMRQMELFVDPLLPDTAVESAIFEIALKEGYGLNARVERLEGFSENVVYRVTDPDKEQSFRICLDGELRGSTVKALALKKDDLFICRGIALDDTGIINLSLQCRLKTI